MAGAWLIWSVCIDRMTHRSSATVRRWGSHSPMFWPLCPQRWNFVAAGLISCFCPEVMVVRRWPRRTDSGSSVPASAARPGFSSKSSICEGPPDWVRKMTRLALAAKCGRCGRPGLPAPSAARARPTSVESAMAPSESPVHWPRK